MNSLRGTVRNRGFSRRRGKDSEEEDREDEEEDEETPATTPATEVTTTMGVVEETKEPENNISYDAEDNVGYDEESPTTEIPSLKVLTPSPTKASIRPPRRPIKIRVHQKPGSKSSSSTTSSKSATPSTPPASSSESLPSLTSSSSSSKTSLSTSTQNEESAERLNDRIPFKYPESKNTYDKPSVTYTKPATPVIKQSNSQQMAATPEGKGSAPTGRTSRTGFGSRYGYSRRYPFLRGNSTRILNGYKPSVTSQSNVPRTSSQAASKTHSSATSQSTLPDRTRDQRTSATFDSTTPKMTLQSETSSQRKTDLYNIEKAQTKSDHKTHGSTTLQTSQGSSNPPSTINTSSSSSQSVSHRGSHSSAPVHNTQSSHKPTEQDTEIGEATDDHKNTNEEHKVEEPTSSSHPKPVHEERSNKEERDEISKENTGVSSRTRISPSFAERFPWLASRYPDRFGSNARLSSSRANGRATTTRTSSSIGANTPILRGTPTRFSGATGASGVSRIQETSKDVKHTFSDDTLKNGARLGADKPLASKNTVSGNPINPGLSTSISTSSSAATSSNSKTDHSSERQELSSEPIHGEISNDNKNDHTKDYINEKSTDMSEKNGKGTDPSFPQKSPTVNSDNLQKINEENLNKNGDTSSRPRSGSTQTSQNYPRRGVGFNGRAYPSVMANRQFSGSRLPMRTQVGENSRMGSSESQSSASSTGSSSSSVPQPVLTSGQITNIGSDSKPTSSASSSSSRLRGRSRFPGLRGKPTNGGQFKPGNGNGNSKIWVNVCIVYCKFDPFFFLTKKVKM